MHGWPKRLRLLGALAYLLLTVDASVGTFSIRDKGFEVTKLPGYPFSLRSRQFAGYIDVGASKSLYYYFVWAEGDASKAPVVLWLNGGPGCSSFCGFVYEHGPYQYKLTKEGVVLQDSPYSWNKVANMIYLDSPAGVGMSYTTDKRQLHTNDTQTAVDANTFIRKFFQRYPEFASNEFYIAGESYAGVYVPSVALEVMEGNGKGQSPTVNLKGYLVGNGCTDPEFDANAFPLFALGKSLISVDMYTEMKTACNDDYYNVAKGSRCEQLLLKLQAEVADLNLYDILETCYYPPDQPPKRQASSQSSYRPITVWKSQVRHLRETHRGWPVQAIMKPGQELQNWQHLLASDPPCIDSSEATAWLNQPEVREAIHAAPIEVTGAWTICTSKIKYTNNVPTMIPIHRRLVEKFGLRALVYSGDHDLCVPHTGSEAWTRSLNYPVVTPWQPWHYREAWTKQVAGYYVEYQGLTYATIKGAGHMTPETNPKESFTMFSAFMNRQPLQDAYLSTSLPEPAASAV